MLETVTQDLRFAVRALRRRPGYAAGAAAVLALGIGPAAAMIAAVDAAFFRPLPFADAGRLAMVYETNPEFGWTDETAAPANALDWREQVPAFADVAAYSEFMNRAAYQRDGEPTLIAISTVSGNFFSVLGVQPALGRTFRWEETWAGSDGVAVLSHALWTTTFGADPEVVGRVLEIGSGRLEVVGVMPAGFTFPDDETQLWTPYGWAPADREKASFRRAHYLRPIARLVPGVSFAEADEQLQVVVRRLQAAYPETNRVMGAGLAPLRAFLVRRERTPLFVLLGAVGLLWLLACANVANLSLVRAVERGREVALRQALGAGRWRLARLLLTESLVVAAAGGAAGLGLGWAGVQAMSRLTRLGVEGATAIALDARVLLATLLAAVASGVVSGLALALRGAGRGVHGRLAAGRRAGASRAALRATGLLVAAEVALALLLVAGAGLVTRSYDHVRRVDPGFRREGALAVQVTAPPARYPEQAHVVAFYDRLVEGLEARADVERAGVVSQLPLAGASWSSQFQAEGWPPERVGFEILHRRADRGYFEALGIPLVRGRLFDARDRQGSPLVVLVNETFARQHFPGEDPIGRRIAYERAATPESTWYEIVGIVGDQAQESPAQPARAEVFEHPAQEEWGRTNWIVLRAAAEPAAALPAVRAVLAEHDPTIPIAQARPLREVWRASMTREEFVLTLLAIFGALALAVAAVGVDAVGAQAARRRTAEIGIRMALGAAAESVVALLVRAALGVVGLGLACGLALALVSTRALGGVLHGVTPTDPPTLAAVMLLLAGVAALAAYLPARRAAHVDPARTLRSE
jgi:putative ABC transport system permease protein